MYGYIYITTNLINNKKYIGQHKSDVFTEDYKGSGTALWNAIDKYGWENFKVELLEGCDSQDELNEREYYWTQYYDAVNSREFYNLREGGNQPGISEETKSKISNTLLEYYKSNCVFYETKKKIKMNHRNYQSDETRIKISESRKGVKFSMEHRKKLSSNHCNVSKENNPFYGKHHSEESKMKLSMSHKNKTNETKNTRYMNNGEITIRVKPENIQDKLNEGFVYGRLLRR